MQIPDSLIFDYFEVNPNERLYVKREIGEGYLHRSNGCLRVQLNVSPGISQLVNGNFMKVDGAVSFYVGEDKFEFTDEASSELKEFHLNRVMVRDLRKLEPAIRQMIKHRKNANIKSANDELGALIPVDLFIYRLVNADFEYSFKGSIFVSILKNGGVFENGDVIKGYTYVKEKDSILYESVQAWRYEQIDPAWLVINGFDFSGLVD